MNTSTFKKIGQELFSLALPMSFTQVIAVGSGFISMAMVSGLGEDVLAASALVFSARITFLLVGSSILFSLSVLIGHAFGERENERIGNFTQQGWLIGLLLSVPVMLVFWYMRPLLLAFGQQPHLTDLAQEFFNANVWNIIPFFLSVSNQQLCYGVRKQKLDLVANLLGVIVLLISSYLLIYGKMGVPKLGIAGLGYALDLQGWFYLLFTTAVFYASPYYHRFKLFQFRLHKSIPDLIRLLKLGWPICIQIGGEMLSFLANATMVGWVSVAALAAYQIVTQYFVLVIVPIFSLAQACGVLIGQAYGEKEYDKMKQTGYAGVLFSVLISLVVGLAFLLFPKQLATLYLNAQDANNQEIWHSVILLFAIYALLQLLDGIRHVLTGSLRGLMDSKFPMIAGLLAIWLVGIPMSYLLAFHFSLGVMGIALGSTIGVFVGMLPLVYRFQTASFPETK